MGNKQVSERLNKALDAIDVPQRSEERVAVLAKLIHIPKFKAETILNGIIEPPILHTLADELEVNADWLVGKSDKKSN